MPKCPTHGMEKSITVGNSRKVCPKCYISEYQAGQHGGTFKNFSTENKKSVALASYGLIPSQALISGTGTGSTEGVDFPERWDNLATKMMEHKTTVAMTCTAVAAYGADLIVAENNTLPPWAEFELMPVIAGALDVAPNLTTVIFLDAAGISAYDLDGNPQAVPVAIAARANVHAELRVLEYLHLGIGARSLPLPKSYIGISKPSCAKCETTIRSYNAWNNGRFEVRHQGHHDSYDAQWKLPRSLTAMPLTVNAQAIEYKVLKRALKS